MLTHHSAGEVVSETARALLRGSQRPCLACGAPASRPSEGLLWEVPGYREPALRQAEARAAWLRAWAMRAYATLGVV
jgi:hypothetical protein